MHDLFSDHLHPCTDCVHRHECVEGLACVEYKLHLIAAKKGKHVEIVDGREPIYDLFKLEYKLSSPNDRPKKKP